MCVGDELARMVVFFFFVGVLQKFFISTVNNVPLDTTGECGITLNPKDHSLVFRIRKNTNV